MLEEYNLLEQKVLNKITKVEELLVDSIYSEIIASKKIIVSRDDLKTEIAVILNEYLTKAFYEIKKKIIHDSAVLILL